VSSIPALDGWDAFLRLMFACALGGLIGFERELRDREAGIRTHLLVSLGSALFTIVSAYGFHEFLTGGGAVVRADPSRIAAQIVTGIGFLGAGAMVAAIGMACGAGYYWPAAATTALTLFALWPLRIVAYRFIERIKPEEDRITIEVKEGHSLAQLLANVHGVRHIEVDDEPDRRVVHLELSQVDEELVGRLADLDYVIGVKWRR
jgi:putative Mg2+ transporter-C (MgtC) family protein